MLLCPLEQLHPFLPCHPTSLSSLPLLLPTAAPLSSPVWEPSALSSQRAPGWEQAQFDYHTQAWPSNKSVLFLSLSGDNKWVLINKPVVFLFARGPRGQGWGREAPGTQSTQRLLFDEKATFFFNQYLTWKSLFEIKLYMWPFGANYQLLIWMLSFGEAEKEENATSRQQIKNIRIIYPPERRGFEVWLMNTNPPASLLRTTAFSRVRCTYCWSEKWVSQPKIVLRLFKVLLLGRRKS